MSDTPQISTAVMSSFTPRDPILANASFEVIGFDWDRATLYRLIKPILLLFLLWLTLYRAIPWLIPFVAIYTEGYLAEFNKWEVQYQVCVSLWIAVPATAVIIGRTCVRAHRYKVCRTKILYRCLRFLSYDFHQVTRDDGDTTPPPVGCNPAGVTLNMTTPSQPPALPELRPSSGLGSASFRSSSGEDEWNGFSDETQSQETTKPEESFTNRSSLGNMMSTRSYQRTTLHDNVSQSWHSANQEKASINRGRSPADWALLNRRKMFQQTQDWPLPPTFKHLDEMATFNDEESERRFKIPKLDILREEQIRIEERCRSAGYNQNEERPYRVYNIGEECNISHPLWQYNLLKIWVYTSQNWRTGHFPPGYIPLGSSGGSRSYKSSIWSAASLASGPSQQA